MQLSFHAVLSIVIIETSPVHATQLLQTCCRGQQSQLTVTQIGFLRNSHTAGQNCFCCTRGQDDKCTLDSCPFDEYKQEHTSMSVRVCSLPCRTTDCMRCTEDLLLKDDIEVQLIARCTKDLQRSPRCFVRVIFSSRGAPTSSS